MSRDKEGRKTKWSNSIIEGSRYPLYRIMSFNRLLMMFINEENTLVHTHLWEDPFEKLLKHSKINWISQNKTTNVANLNYNCWYGQCWSDKEADDAMWRVFSPNRYTERYVKVKTTASLLRKSFEEVNKRDDVKLYLEPVDYKNVDDQGMEYGKSVAEVIRNYTSSLFIIPKQLINQLTELGLLLTKREAFDHESEVRLLACVKNKEEQDSDIWSYHIKPQELIEEIELDPWTKDTERELCKKTLSKFFDVNKITVSPLYKDVKKQLEHIDIEIPLCKSVKERII